MNHGFCELAETKKAITYGFHRLAETKKSHNVWLS